jgi:hypothetical protein
MSKPLLSKSIRWSAEGVEEVEAVAEALGLGTFTDAMRVAWAHYTLNNPDAAKVLAAFRKERDKHRPRASD